MEIRGKSLAHLVLTTDPPVFTAGSGAITVAVELQDKEGRPSQTVPVELAADFGKLSGPETVSLGRQTARLALPYEFKNRSRVKITVDEIRVIGAVRSADWIAAQHLSMTDGFITFGPEENVN